ncbi:hypothetical protein KFL_006730010 [Klebsormidium nitens]|uniref:Uncharacterized protein n=1 Tax=Klebsormidium nitens TaxID=105231 RepID=A0A1Y1IIG6_KLENI|nr:hypothetical protein KFL_006730010 [Klebsormidium nitens]|eukprot:GAQ90680.1 hypothetical protein KFL_006730010 [Klebsormidium nitens]
MPPGASIDGVVLEYAERPVVIRSEDDRHRSPALLHWMHASRFQRPDAHRAQLPNRTGATRWQPQRRSLTP